MEIKDITGFMEERTAEILDSFPDEIRAFGDTVKNLFPIKKITSAMEDFTYNVLDNFINIIHIKNEEWENTEIKWDFFSKKSLGFTTAIAVVLLTATIFQGILAYNTINTAYAISYDGKIVAKVRDCDKFETIVEQKEKELSDFYGYEKKLSKPFSYSADIVTDENLTGREEIRKFVSEKTSGEGLGYELYIGREKIGMLKNTEEIESLKSGYIDMSTVEKLKEHAEIKEQTGVKRVFCKESDFQSPRELADDLRKNQQNVRYYVTEEGESLPFIAKLENIDYKLLRELNPDVDNFPESGTKLKLSEGPVFTVLSSEVKVVEEDLDFEVEYEKDDNLYDVRSYVKQEGVKGKVKAKDKLYYENNELVSVERLESETLEEPVTKIIVKGAKATPKYIASGSFSYPTRGRFTSGFGRRWGRMHKGIDLAGAHGSSIKAADGGTVVFVGRYYGLGKMIKIDHGNGYETVYGHLSGYKVSVGDKVGKGETIGYMGNTGNSTGTHLHFEVHKNGTPVNPISYLK